MKKKIVLLTATVLLAAILLTQTSLAVTANNEETNTAYEAFKLPKGVACEVICNGVCPVPPEGWVLSEGIGESGAFYDSSSSKAAAGRCAHETGSPIEEGEERMCCYFQQ
ncbi:MAG: hypothetical protein ABH821_02795 [archaeon]